MIIIIDGFFSSEQEDDNESRDKVHLEIGEGDEGGYEENPYNQGIIL